ncbi:MAG: DUF3149 domain-containing protein [Laribacter sp.]|nr:DUF3149 domain-containing protein [Laribacter sp.]MBP9528632.1 DUF3149 domain-containing protein [Laribacter sp.]MBP9609855.1 DUF3149 domain-containing protein [Laribacter sp.]
MELWKELLSSEVGIMSLIVIAIAFIVPIYCARYFMRKSHEEPCQSTKH